MRSASSAPTNTATCASLERFIGRGLPRRRLDSFDYAGARPPNRPPRRAARARSVDPAGEIAARTEAVSAGKAVVAAAGGAAAEVESGARGEGAS